MNDFNDIAFEQNLEKGYFDIGFTEDGCDLKGAVNLRNAVGICIFSDRRSASDDPVPNEKGYAGDVFNEIGEESLGSKLWMRLRGLALSPTLTDAEADVKESLRWFLDDKIASKILVEATYIGRDKSTMSLKVEIVRLTGENLRFNYVWTQPLFAD